MIKKPNSPDRPQDQSQPLFARALASCRAGMIAVGGFSLCINLLMLTAPLYMLQVFDRVIAGRSTDTLLYLTLIAGFALIVLGVLEAVRAGVMTKLGFWLDRRLGAVTLETSVSASLGREQGPSIQGLRDLTVIRNFVTGPAVFSILDAPWTPIFVGVIFLMHPLLGWLALAGAVVLFSLAAVNELATRSLLQRANVASVGALNRAEAAARNADVARSMAMMPALVRHWQKRNDESLSLQGRASRRGGAITAASKSFRLFLQISLLAAGAWLVLGAEITPGVMIAASILMARALAPVEGAINSWRSVVAARQAYGRVRELLADATEGEAAMPLPAPTGELSLENLTYAHPGANEPVLRNVGFQLRPGESLGLVGPTATGKTTLARLLIGNLRPLAGHVRLDSADVAGWDANDLGRHVGYLPQDVELFAGTVRENIARMSTGAPEDVIRAAQLAGVHEMILRLPNGYETEIGDGGAILSGGQRQRIGLARAIFGGPKFVVLDEPNASLDLDGDRALIKTMKQLQQDGVTLVIATHRPSILRQVDKILVLGDGGGTSFGSREEIMPKIAGQLAGPISASPLTLSEAV